MTDSSENPDAADYFLNPPPRRFGALALLEREGSLALISRSYWTEVSRWGLPGGSAMPGELPRRALSRLIAEKLRLRVTPGALLAVDFAPAVAGRYVEGVNFIFHVPVPPDTHLTVAEDCGYAEVRWGTPEQVHELAIDHELWRIQEVLRSLRTGHCRDLLIGIPLPSTPYAPGTVVTEPTD